MGAGLVVCTVGPANCASLIHLKPNTFRPKSETAGALARLKWVAMLMTLSIDRRSLRSIDRSIVRLVSRPLQMPTALGLPSPIIEMLPTQASVDPPIHRSTHLTDLHPEPICHLLFHLPVGSQPSAIKTTSHCH